MECARLQIKSQKYVKNGTLESIDANLAQRIIALTS